MSTGTRIPSLDGLRAISIGLVITSHLYYSKTMPMLAFLWRFQLGDLGVRVFFVISGFLITQLLLAESQRSGRIDIGNFYVRRVLRIFPAYYAFLGFVACVAALGLLEVNAVDLTSAALYVSNYVNRPPALAHTWSLSVEEQFYLLWPGLILLLGMRRAIWFAAAFVLAAAALRAAHSFPLSVQTNIFWVRFETAGDAIAIGCVFAGLRDRLWDTGTYRYACTPAGTAASCLAIGFLASSHRWPWFWNSLGITLMNACIVLVLDGCIRARGHWHFWLLNSRPVVFLGVLSYSVYLWQQLFVTGLWKIPPMLGVLLTLLVAGLSYAFIEQPVLRWRQRRRPVAAIQ